MRLSMKLNHDQQGVGLVEVIVALVILSLGVLGIIAMQLKAVDASDEAGTRVQAVALAQDLSERIRVNPTALDRYILRLNETPQDATTSSAQLCYTGVVTPRRMARCDVAQILIRAQRYGMRVAMPLCSGMASGRRCIYVSWSKTMPTDGDAATDCTKNGLYKANSRCIVFESY